MNSAAEANGTKSPDKKSQDKKSANPNATRETVESVVVAFILAFLFRAFVAEAFVIPTGSMAPTLMGAHKDTICEYCGAQYQSTASPEYDKDDGSLTDTVAVGSVCAMCRATNAFDLAGNRNHSTFSGDRILVSKFDYLFKDPKRWDVLVFKYPLDARMNYIKRLVGLPGEKLHIEGGDVYLRKIDTEPWSLARKPPHKALAMMQVVSDTNHQGRELVKKGWPSLWQPQAKSSASPQHAWSVTQNVDDWSAQLQASQSSSTQWLRYYHKFVDRSPFERGSTGQEIGKPYDTNLITDFLAYNTTMFGPRGAVYDFNERAATSYLGRWRFAPWKLKPEITSENRALDVMRSKSIKTEGIQGPILDGLHWVSDLAAEFDVEVKSSTGTLSVDLVEFGVHYRCDVDIASGKAQIVATDNGKTVELFGDSKVKVTPETTVSIRGPGRYRIRYANIDDQLMLWINGSLVEFNVPTVYDSHKLRTGNARRPYWTPDDPLDAAPIAIGGTTADLTVHRAQVWRDIYYIAIQPPVYSDYNLFAMEPIIASIKDPKIAASLQRMDEFDVITYIYAQPELWEKTPLFASRGVFEHELRDGEFFPMGDNSAASSDARDWRGHNYVERRFLIGKALLVFWPHSWKSPVPYPNLARMGRIR